ncbi:MULTISPECIES: hypothetical protein [Actinomycetes]
MTNRFAAVVRRWAPTLLEPTQTSQWHSLISPTITCTPHHRSGAGFRR